MEGLKISKLNNKIVILIKKKDIDFDIKQRINNLLNDHNNDIEKIKEIEDLSEIVILILF